MAQLEDPRRVPRLGAHCRVQVRDRYTTWQAETDDLGPRGCQLVSPRPANVGDMITMSIESPHLPTPLRVLGLVCWARGTDGRIGVSFAGAIAGSPSPERWFEELVAVDPNARVRDARRSVDLDAVLYLAAPPDEPVALSRAELRFLHAVGDGWRLSELKDRVGAGARFEHLLFAVLSRRLVTLVRASASTARRWAPVLERAEHALAASEIARRTGPSPTPAPVARPAAAAPTPPTAGPHPPRPAAVTRGEDAQRLYERAVELLVAGNASAAETLVRSAVELAPEDPVLQSVLRRFARH